MSQRVIVNLRKMSFRVRTVSEIYFVRVNAKEVIRGYF